MTDRYCRSGATGTATGADWTNAKTTLAAVAAIAAAGDRVFVSEDHAESQTTAMTVTFLGSPTNPNFVYCVNHLGTVPPVAADLRTSATVSCGSGSVAMTINGCAEIYGITFNGATNNNSGCFIKFGTTNGNSINLYSCTIAIRTAHTTPGIFTGGTTAAAAADCSFYNCTISYAATSANGIVVCGRLKMRNCTVSGNCSTLFIPVTTGVPYVIHAEGCDFSGVTGTLFVSNSPSTTPGRTMLKDCKLNASYTMQSNFSNLQNEIDVIRSDSGNTNYKIERHNYFGDLTTETTVVRTGGATNGITPHSWKIVTTANSSASSPFESGPITIWNDVVSGNITLTMYGIAAAIPYNDEMWIEAQTLSDASFPISSLVSSQMTFLDTHAQYTSDGSSWGGSVAPFSVALTLAPRQKGFIYIYIRAAKASQTYYIDPKPIITDAPQISKSSIGMNELFAGVSRARCGIGQ